MIKQLRRDLDNGLHLGYRRLEYYCKCNVWEDRVKYKQEIKKNNTNQELKYDQWAIWSNSHEHV